jgi:GrpB-like predicted nucleotidyltransferase (UPF0157 family)
MTADEPVRVVPYDAAWPALFARESALLSEALGGWIVGGVHHIGSTAVPGLAAKPVVDILVGVADLSASRSCFQPLADLRYVYAPYRTEVMHWFCKPHPARRTHHLHLVPAGSERFAGELAFRDRLRGDPSVAREYEALKITLAREFERDREAYTEAKASFIAAVLAHASR